MQKCKDMIARWEHYIRIEMEAEVMACVHGYAMVLTWLLMKFIAGGDGISFLYVVEMGLHGYLLAWLQRLVFWKEKAYSIREYRLRETIWCALPIVLTFPMGKLLGWFSELPAACEWGFYGLLVPYYIVMWVMMKRFFFFYTRQLNELLDEYKKAETGGER